jgi:hypothetical protein
MSELTGAPGNWRTPYRELLQFSRLAFAWEYLRRNEKFRSNCRHGSVNWRRLDPRGNLEIFQSDAPSAAGGDCLFASSVDLDARSATVFWHPDSCPSVLRAFALPDSEFLEPFSLADGGLPATLLLSADGMQHVLIRDGVRRLQLTVHGASLLRPVGLLVDTGWSPAIASHQDRSLKRLRAYRASGALQELDYPPDPYAARLALVLQALDGWRAGARHRDIAEALYGHERVAKDWADPRESLRDQVRYAISRGRTLMEHGYRAFLQ